MLAYQNRPFLFAMDKLKIDDDMLVVAADNILFFSFQEFVDFAKAKGTSSVRQKGRRGYGPHYLCNRQKGS